MRAMARVSETFVDRFSNPCLRTMMEMEAKMRKSFANRIEAAARRAYNEIDSAVCGIEDATSGEIGAVRKVMDETIGDHYE
jgi:hypothetical protein